MNPFKMIYVLLDGVGDLPDSKLNGVTPLQAAFTPNLDRLTRNGKLGRVITVGEGIAPESDVAVFSMLGYDVQSQYVGRGVVEAIGAGLEFKDGHLALRGNFATVSDGRRIVDRRAGRNLEQNEVRELAEAIKKKVVPRLGEVKIQFAATVGHRCVLTISDPNMQLSNNISNTDPSYERIGSLGVAKTQADSDVKTCTPLDSTAEAKRSAQLVNEFTEHAANILRTETVNSRRESAGKLPANFILLRDAGNKIPNLNVLTQKTGLRFSALVNMPVEVGISQMVGMKVEQDETGDDYRAKADLALKLLSDSNIVYVHIKGPDEPGHDGQSQLKKKIIEKIDAEFFGTLSNQITDQVALLVSADHSTPCQLKAHSADPVPVLLSGGGLKRGDCCRFTEKDALKGSLGQIKGVEVLALALGLLGHQMRVDPVR